MDVSKFPFVYRECSAAGSNVYISGSFQVSVGDINNESWTKKVRGLQCISPASLVGVKSTIVHE